MRYIILLIILLPLLRFALPGRKCHCPACLRLGRVRYFGRYHCDGCEASFFLSDMGRPVRSMWQAAWWPLLAYAIVWLAFLGFSVYGGGSIKEAWLILFVLASYLVHYLPAAWSKRFSITP